MILCLEINVYSNLKINKYIPHLTDKDNTNQPYKFKICHFE